MYLGVKAVKPVEEYKLFLTFENDEQRIFDMRPYLDKGVFAQLQDKTLFQSVHVCFDTVEWSNGADLCPEMLYNNSVSVQANQDETEHVHATALVMETPL